jgi:hypothetical protein
MMGGKSDEAVFQDLVTTLSNKLAVYDKILGKQKYLAGDVSASYTFSGYSYSLLPGYHPRRPLPHSLWCPLERRWY